MGWLILLLSAVLEAVWATALGRSDGLREIGWAIVFIVALIASMGGLGLAMRQIPISTAYTVWTGVGAALTVGFAMVVGDEPVSALKIVFLAGIIGCVVGLRLVKEPAAEELPR